MEAPIAADDRKDLKAGDKVTIALESDETKTYEGTVRYISELPGVDDFSALAETRLIEGLERLFYNYTHNQDVSSLFAELFKMYVLGNEPEDPRQPEYLAKYAEYLPRMKDDKQISADQSRQVLDEKQVKS